MILPLNTTDQPTMGVVLFNKHNVIAMGLKANMVKFQAYLRTNNFRTDGDNVIIGILNTISSYIGLTPKETYQLILADEDRIANLYNITTDYHTGKVVTNGFLGNNIDEVLYLERDDLTFTDFKSDRLRDWESCQPVIIRTHPIDDITIMMLDDKVNTSATGVSVMSIDIALLGAMYHEWLDQQEEALYANEDSVFVMRHVVSNMLPSYLTIATYNRFNTAVTGGQPCELYHKASLKLINYSGKLDVVYDEVIAYMSGAKLQITDILPIVPTYLSTADELVIDIQLANTKQCFWIHLLTWLPYLIGPGEISKDINKKHRDSNLTAIQRHFRTFASTRAITSCPGEVITEELAGLISTITELYQIKL